MGKIMAFRLTRPMSQLSPGPRRLAGGRLLGRRPGTHHSWPNRQHDIGTPPPVPLTPRPLGRHSITQKGDVHTVGLHCSQEH